MEDEEAFGLAVRAAQPWLREPTNFEILESRIDADAVASIRRLLRRLARRSPRLRPRMTALADTVASFEGKTVRQLLRTGQGS
jgi:hypothetical protein